MPISYARHAQLYKSAFQAAGLVVDKTTHVQRVYGAQMMASKGADPQLVQRAGGWIQDSCGTAYIISGMTPQALLCLGNYRELQDFAAAYYDDRFRVAVPEELVDYVMPPLRAFAAAATAACEAVAAGDKSPAMVAAARCDGPAKVMRIAVLAAIQDALVLAGRFPTTCSSRT